MAFNIQRFVQFTGGGAGANSIWLYHSTEDNLASIANATVNVSALQQAFSTYGVTARKGDVIIGTYTTINAGTGQIFVVPADWNANGASIIAIAQVKS